MAGGVFYLLVFFFLEIKKNCLTGFKHPSEPVSGCLWRCAAPLSRVMAALCTDLVQGLARAACCHNVDTVKEP